MPAPDIGSTTHKKTVKTRIIQKHDTEVNWKKATTFVPKLGEIIIYDIDSTYDYERVKVGDGNTVVSSLPFITDGYYIKPDDGIPKSDLSSGVQSSLDKADTAIQSHQKITTGNSNGTIAVDGTDVSVKGLKALAYKDSLTKADVGLGSVVNAG